VRQNGKLQAVSWPEALDAVKAALSVGADEIGVVAGDLIEAEQAKAALDFFRSSVLKARTAARRVRSTAPAACANITC
jgi:NADH-quinone oxidoreductase subunit G